MNQAHNTRRFKTHQGVIASLAVVVGLSLVIYGIYDLATRPERHNDFWVFAIILIQLPIGACLFSAGFFAFFSAILFKRFWTGAMFGLLVPGLPALYFIVTFVSG